MAGRGRGLLLACESILRVPPLILVDEIFRTSFGFGGRLFTSSSSKSDPESLNSKDPTVKLLESKRHEELSLVSEFLSEDVSSSSQSSDAGLASSNSSEVSVSSSIVSYLSSLLDSWYLFEDALKNGTLNFIRGSDDSIGSDSSTTNSTELFLNSFTTSDGSESASEELSRDLMRCVEVFASVLLFFAAVVMFMLATQTLIKLYAHLTSFATIYFAYMMAPLTSYSLSVSSLSLILSNVIIRVFLAATFFVCRVYLTSDHESRRGRPNQAPPENGNSVNDTVQNNTEDHLPITLLDNVLMFLLLISGVVQIPVTIFIPVVICLHVPLIASLPMLYNFLLSSWAETKRIQNEYGLSHLIQVESNRLRINSVFRLFWITRAIYDAFFRCCDEPTSLVLRHVMTHGTETFTGVIGLTVTVAAICHQIGDFLLWILYLGTNNEVDANRFGSISTVLFFILSLQTGLTSLDPEKRLDRLMKNIVLLGTALFHALHQMVAPLLHAFRSFQPVQVRAASVSCAFLAMSFALTFYVLRWSTISTWSLAVLALAIEFKIKVIISLIISLVVYLSQLVQYPDIIEKFVNLCRRIFPKFLMRFFDQLYDQVSHEDMVFYLKTIANVAEFITGIFLFVNAVWIFLFESASAIRAIGMSIHAYFNIWCDAQKGIRIYCQRKTASKKIESLADASEEQIQAMSDDVCSICYEGFESAKVTNCGHLFHAVCLRKWLYVQNTCPMCHEILYKEENISDTASEAPEVVGNNLHVAPAEPVQAQASRSLGLNLEVPRNPDQFINLSDSDGEELEDMRGGSLVLRQRTENLVRDEQIANRVAGQLQQTGLSSSSSRNVTEVQSRSSTSRVAEVERNQTVTDDDNDLSSDDEEYVIENGDDDDDSSGIDVDTDEDEDQVGLQQNRGLVVFL